MKGDEMKRMWQILRCLQWWCAWEAATCGNVDHWSEGVLSNVERTQYQVGMWDGADAFGNLRRMLGDDVPHEHTNCDQQP